jgi:hypothetical protein
MTAEASTEPGTYVLTHQQLTEIGRLQCRVTSITISWFSGVATVMDRYTTMAIIMQDGHVSRAYRFEDGTYAHPSYQGPTG